MNESFTLADIEQCTGISVDRLRYVLDSQILPGTRNDIIPDRAKGRGVTRYFGGLSAFGIVVTVLMLDAGIKRETVKRCLDLLVAYAPGTRDISSTLISKAHSDLAVNALEIGDKLNVRLVRVDAKKNESGRWIQVETGAEVLDYVPLVSIRINLVQLRKKLTR